MFRIAAKVLTLIICPFFALYAGVSLVDAHRRCVASSVATIIEMGLDGMQCNLSNITIYIDRLYKEIFKK